MSFKSPTYSEKSFSADKISMNVEETSKIKLRGNEILVPPTVAVVVALAETSAAAVVVATAGAVSWLVSCDSQLAPVSQEYKSILNEIEMRKLDHTK